MRNFIVGAITATLLIAQPLQAQTVELTSLYHWRGSELDGASLQPDLPLYNGLVQVGAWGSYGLNSDYSEIDLTASYVVSDDLGVSITSYYTGGDFFDFGEDGAQDIEIGASYQSDYGNFSVGIFVRGTGDDNPVWLQFETPELIEGLILTIGGGTDTYTEDGKAAVVVVGLSAYSDLGSVSLVANVDSRQAWLIGSLGLL